MALLQLVFVACIGGDPDQCRHVPGPVFSPQFTLSECLSEGPAVTAAWLAHNPGHIITEWTCVVAVPTTA